jgi:very-short-patch-repair endonuclease
MTMEKIKEYEKIVCDILNFKQRDGLYLCPLCNKVFTKYGIKTHLRFTHFGLYSKETRNKISSSMKKAHKEGRAWNIGKSRWNNKKSYPEEFFSKVIESEFTDKNFEFEFSFGIYSLDFAWPHLKKAIEIDGDQHYRFSEYIERDKRKDIYLRENGWEVLRIRWKDFCKDTKNYIKIAKDFIESDIFNLKNNLENYYLEKKLLLKVKKVKKDIKRIKEINKCHEIALKINMLKDIKRIKEINKCHEIALKINMLKDSNIDFAKPGWVSKVSKLLNISHPHVKRLINKHYPELLKNAYIKKNVKNIKKIEKMYKEINKCHEIALKINMLKDSNIDFTKWGWVSKVSKLIKINRHKVKEFLIENNI